MSPGQYSSPVLELPATTPTPILETLPSGPELLDLYREWGHITRLESEAIQASAWLKVEALQNSKYRLQPPILEATQSIQAEAQRKMLPREAIDRELRLIVHELIQSERRNADKLASMRENLEQQRAELNRTSRNLRQIHRAYSSGNSPAWHSYS